MTEVAGVPDLAADAVKVETITWTMSPHHPARRLFARLIDYIIFIPLVWIPIAALLDFAQIPEMKAQGGAQTILTQLSLMLLATLASFPIALCMSIFGHSPGKWMMGLTVEGKDGKKLSYITALRRELSALFRGMAGTIIGFFAVIIAGYYARKHLLAQGETTWDAKFQSKILYRSHFGGRIGVAVGLFFGVPAVLGAIAGFIEVATGK